MPFDIITAILLRMNDVYILMGDQRNFQLPIQWVQGTLSPGIKRPEREADHSPPTSSEG
jgi:hypothetical protein